MKLCPSGNHALIIDLWEVHAVKMTCEHRSNNLLTVWQEEIIIPAGAPADISFQKKETGASLSWYDSRF